MDLLLEQTLRDIAHQAATSPLNDLRQPSQKQLDAGVYKKGHYRLHGLGISIENPQGSVRSGTDSNGKRWQTTMHAHYGYIKGTVGADNGHLDCFLGPDCENCDCPVFIINQLCTSEENFGNFDEHKIMIGYHDEQAAISGYMINFSPGWKGFGSIRQTTIDGLKEWIKNGDTRAPYGDDDGWDMDDQSKIVSFEDFNGS